MEDRRRFPCPTPSTLAQRPRTPSAPSLARPLISTGSIASRSTPTAAYAEAVEGGLGSWIEAAITCPVEYDGTVASIPRPELDEVTIGAILTTRPRADGRFAIPAFETIHTNLSAAFPKLAEAARARLAGDAA